MEAKARELAEKQVKASDQAGSSPFERVTSTALALKDAQQAAVQELLDKTVPDPNCKECAGSGIVKTTVNPNGKWTRWEIGSHFQPGFVLEGCLKEVPDNFDIVPVKLIDPDAARLPVAIITPDGKWHAWGDPYWFGTSRVDDRGWENTVRKILGQYADATLVVVECQS